jgi:hypothetical protein
MLTRVCLTVALALPISVLAQVTPTANGPTENESPMSAPPMVSGQALPTSVESAENSNYLAGSVAFEAAYNDNLFPYYVTQAISGMSYSIRPRISFDQSISRFHQTWNYSPGFTIYQPIAARNEFDQNVSMILQYRLSEHATLSGGDSFLKSSNVFNQGDSQLGGSVSGSPSSSPADLLFPFINRLSNTANAQISYQYSANSMIGGGGTVGLFQYPNQTQSSGIYDSTSRGGSAFYNRRIMGTQSIGANYQYVEFLGNPAAGQVEMQLHTLMGFYSLTLEHRLSLSVSAGPQHSEYAQTSVPSVGSWRPSVMASIGWQGDRGSLVANYRQTATTGGGLIGSHESKNASASASWRMARTWTAGATATYSIYGSVANVSGQQGGHTVSGTASIDHPMGEHFVARLGYQRIHLSYGGTAAASTTPDSDREFVSISYQFKRPLGR